MNKIRLHGIVGIDFDSEAIASAPDGDLEITLNTDGGLITEGLSIFSAIQDHKGKTTVIVEKAFSMGSIIMLAADEIVAKRDSSLIMIHRPWSGGVGNADDLKKAAADLDMLEAKMMSIYMQRFNKTEDELSKMLGDETYLSAEEALEFGLVDTVISGSKEQLYDLALQAVACEQKYFDVQKMLAKVNQIKAKPTFFSMCEAVKTLKDAEKIFKHRGFSNSEATAMVGAIKRALSESEDAEPTGATLSFPDLSFKEDLS